jgi:hypothetical protein
MSGNVHHRLCDWNIDPRPECCTCGVYWKAPWFDAYVRGVVGQAAHLPNASYQSANRATDDVVEKERAA